jgi:hypothetical protein
VLIGAITLVPLACASVWVNQHAIRAVLRGDGALGSFGSDGSVDGFGPGAPGFERVLRVDSVLLEREFNLSNLRIPGNEIHTLVALDGIPALQDPLLGTIAEAAELPATARVVEIEVGAEERAIAVPLGLLERHEIVNMTVDREPIAVTYCPLCDSAAVFSRRVGPWSTARGARSGAAVLEFGVSGALYNSNVLMYDRKDRGLWSQIEMRCVSGPRAGQPLRTVPVRVVPFFEFRVRHPHGRVVGGNAPGVRGFDQSPYTWVQDAPNPMVQVAGMGDELPLKTLGVGVRAIVDGKVKSWFIARHATAGRVTVDIELGEVAIEFSERGIVVVSAPPDVDTVQTQYFAWSAFFPDTRVIAEFGAVPRPLETGGGPTGEAQDKAHDPLGAK